MKAVKYAAIFLAGFFLFAGCAKELSYESGTPPGPASGYLQHNAGNCLPIIPKGQYVKDSAMTDSNYVTVQVFISVPGTYKIVTDTVNGFSFKDSGFVTSTGLQDFKLKASGSPVLSQETNFIVTFDSTFCSFSIVVSDTARPTPITTPVTSADYFPTSDSSNWTYQINSGYTSPDDTAHVAVSTNDQTISGNTYKTFITDQDTDRDTSYYRKGNGLYYTYGGFNEYQIYDTTESKVDYIFLKDNVPVSSTWESPEVNATFQTTRGKTKIRFTIEGKDIPTTVGNTTIDSVIQVKREYMFAQAPAGTYQTIITANFYYAKNIGLIKVELSDPLPVTINVTRWEIYY